MLRIDYTKGFRQIQHITMAVDKKRHIDDLFERYFDKKISKEYLDYALNDFKNTRLVKKAE